MLVVKTLLLSLFASAGVKGHRCVIVEIISMYVSRHNKLSVKRVLGEKELLVVYFYISANIGCRKVSNVTKGVIVQWCTLCK